MTRDHRIAIVGLGGIFPDAPDLDQFWSNLEAGVASSREVPPGRWLLDPDEAYDPRVGLADHVYSTRGCFVEGFELDPEGLDLDPDLLGRLDPSVHLALHAARMAWRDAKTAEVDKARVGVVFGNLVLPTEAASAMARGTMGLEPDDRFEPLNTRVAGLPAGLVATALGLGGGAYTIDAACASSLYAIKLAADELIEGRADAMIAGGLSRPDPLYTQMGFSQLRALSPSGVASPFGQAADGLVVGEGSGMFVLKRLADAVRHGDTIHGVIVGVGLSNDIDGGLLAPDSEGQLRAMGEAYRQSGWSPSDVDLIECHATGTPVGDAVEFASLRALWAGSTESNRCVIGSVKSNVGHALTAAGAAGLLKVLLGLRHHVIPPTAGFDRPADKLEIDRSPFRILDVAEPWEPRRTGLPRRVAISGFGFGGINAHVLIEEWLPGTKVSTSQLPFTPEPVAIVGIAAQFGPAETLATFQAQVLGGLSVETHAIAAIDLPTDRFRIPPRELEEMLPQQSLLLMLAAEAVDDAGWVEQDRTRFGVIVGLGLDLNTTNFHVRWSLPDEHRDSISPALSANRTMGALGSIVASRVAREFRLGGPSFTVSSEETSAFRAIDVASRMLSRGELDGAIVGAVDFPSDIRAKRAEALLHPTQEVGDGAGVIVLKRLADAERAGDRIYAVLRGVELATGRVPRITSDDTTPIDAEGDVGYVGAASGMASIVKASLCLSQQVLPGERGARFWLRDRIDGPRHAVLTGSGVDGNVASLILEGHESSAALNPPARRHPLGPMPATIVVVEADDRSGLLAGLDELAELGRDQSPLDLARVWWRRHPADPSRRLAVAMVVDGPIEGLIATARGLVESDGQAPARSRPADRVWFSPRPIGKDGGLALVFPGMGNHFASMGRDLAARWPEVLRSQDQTNDRLRSQMAAGTFWEADPPPSFDDHRVPIFGQVTLGAMVADLLAMFGVKPDAAIGYSLGETTALFATRAWVDRDVMFDRFSESPLFRTDLAGSCDAARIAWGLGDGESVDWVAGILHASPSEVVEKLATIERAYLLIVNTDRQVVVGGQRQAVDRLVEAVGARFHPLPLVSTVHCEVVRPVEAAYRDLHVLPTNSPSGIRYYSGASGQSYLVDRDSAADSILAHALHGVDFPGVIRSAYEDGIRAFVEVGPGASCTRMIGEILEGQPHLASSATPGEHEPVVALLSIVARLAAERFPMDLAPLFGGIEPKSAKGRTIRVPVGLPPSQPPPPMSHRVEVPVFSRPFPTWEAPSVPDFSPSQAVADPLTRQAFSAESARGQAHSAFLRTSGGIGGLMARQGGYHLEIVGMLASGQSVRWAERTESHQLSASNGEPRSARPTLQGNDPHRDEVGIPRSLDRDQCLSFAIGAIGDVLGPDFAKIDAFPTRVRLPDEPLMLVDRILQIEGEPLSMTSGRVVTEHDVLPGAWYLDGGRIPTCIAVESGQADLFLSAYLGIDFETKGLAVYRLLDAAVTFHDELPGVGDVIHYDIHIDSFFRQGDSRLFRFRFEATVDGQPLMSMSQGIAGFFTDEALAAGQGVVKTALDLRPMPGVKPDDWSPPVPMGVESMDDAQVEALRRGDLATAFGPSFAGLNLNQAAPLPGGMMRLVDRVVEIDPTGGRYGIGRIVAEADIRPDDWFMTCHFVDDQVMPGTLMFECCLHTLRIFLSRMGWIGEEGEVVCQPVTGISSKLKCRGQVVATTKKVTYEVTLKELGFGPEPFAVVDALMYADGRPIVEITDMSLRMTGLDRETLATIWDRGAPLYDSATILAFSNGKPSEAFGDRYRIFDETRVIARLPGPPYQFLDRVVEVAGEPWVMAPGAMAMAEYDVPADAWYFEADRQDVMPFAVLLETALQPCGWLAAYMGSALTSDVDLSFRNLGGSARQIAAIGRDVGTLVTRATTTKVSRSGGMIIQQYDFTMTANGRPVYQGETTFGFFSKAALSNQVGIRDATPYQPTAGELARARSFDYPESPPFPNDRWRMIDRVEEFVADGGPHGLGYVRGTWQVRPDSWLFQAHFYQDPVVPGSLGLESFQQLLKVVAGDRWGIEGRFEPIGLGDLHKWTYRGQILPTDRLATTRLVVTEVDDDGKWIKADGFLDVDGRIIYGMTDFTLRFES